MPVLERVAANLFAICPDFPTPVINILPLQFEIFVHNSSTLKFFDLEKAFNSSNSIKKAFFASFWKIFFFISNYNLHMLRLFSSKILFVIFLSQNLFADKIPELHEYIDSNAQYFLTVIKEEGSNYDDNPEEFKERLKNIWEPMVDVKVVSRLILSSKIYSSATENQKKLFEERTKKLLLDTYVSTLLEFDNYQIVTDENIKVNKKTFEVSVNFFSDSNSFVTKLTVYKNSLGQYRIVNIIVDGINLGLIFRNQFQDAYLENNSDLDIAIESWKPTTL